MVKEVAKLIDNNRTEVRGSGGVCRGEGRLSWPWRQNGLVGGPAEDLGLALAGEGQQPGGWNTHSPPAGHSELGLEEAPALL